MKPFKRNKSENIFPYFSVPGSLRSVVLLYRAVDAGLNPVLELISKT
jgi:hypothetical protein